MSSSSDLISTRRERVLLSYREAELINYELYASGDYRGTSEYIYRNQKEDAANIVDKFYKNNRRVICIQKKTKVGADGLMIEIAKLMATHNDDSFVVNPSNVRILTGMSNAGWEKDMKDKSPGCFKDKIFHHGQLLKAELKHMKNALIIVDEIDSGDKEGQVLHNTLKGADVLKVKHMEDNNIRFVFISATMIKELHDIYRWGELHELYKMTIPSAYMGHKDFVDMGIVKEFYALNSQEAAEKWVQEDILDYYNMPCMCKKCNPGQYTEQKDFRVHLVRVTAKNVTVVQNACIKKGVKFKNHTSSDRLTEDEIKEFFKEPLTQHIVLGVKGFFRRANLIPNSWKLRIGATHELHTRIVDNNVQIQGLVGRMTGYWRDDIEASHTTGPHRTSIRAIEEYEKTYNNPYGLNSYQTAGFKKVKGKVSANPTMLTVKNIENIEPYLVDSPVVEDPNDPRTIPEVITVTSDEYSKIVKNGAAWDEKSVLDIISKYKPAVVDTMKGKKRLQITESREKNPTYEKRITDFVNAHNQQKKYTLGTGDVKENSYQIFLDAIEKRIIVSIYFGSRNKKAEPPKNTTHLTSNASPAPL